MKFFFFKECLTERCTFGIAPKVPKTLVCIHPNRAVKNRSAYTNGPRHLDVFKEKILHFFLELRFFMILKRLKSWKATQTLNELPRTCIGGEGLPNHCLTEEFDLASVFWYFLGQCQKVQCSVKHFLKKKNSNAQ